MIEEVKREWVMDALHLAVHIIVSRWFDRKLQICKMEKHEQIHHPHTQQQQYRGAAAWKRFLAGYTCNKKQNRIYHQRASYKTNLCASYSWFEITEKPLFDNESATHPIRDAENKLSK